MTLTYTTQIALRFFFVIVFRKRGDERGATSNYSASYNPFWIDEQTDCYDWFRLCVNYALIDRGMYLMWCDERRGCQRRMGLTIDGLRL